MDIISSQGTITYGGHHGLILKYETDFEDVIKVDNRRLNLSIPHTFVFEGEGGARIWMEEDFGHSGKRCLGMELTDITKSRRNEFDITSLEKLVGDELFVSVWLYLHSNWKLHSTPNWYEMVVIFEEYETWVPYLCIWVKQPDISQAIFDIIIGGRDVNGNQYTLDRIKNFPLPLGRWFNVQYYLLRHQTNGAVQIWIDGTLIFDRTGLITKVKDEYYCTVAKIYYDTHDTFSPYQIWVDDLEIYGTP